VSIGGGLYDRDPEPDRHKIVPPARIKAAQREWGFWFAMVIGVWASFQGQAVLAFFFVVAAVLVPSCVFLWSQAKDQLLEAKEKGFWR
jgi:hypothetical protein